MQAAHGSKAMRILLCWRHTSRISLTASFRERGGVGRVGSAWVVLLPRRAFCRRALNWPSRSVADSTASCTWPNRARSRGLTRTVPAEAPAHPRRPLCGLAHTHCKSDGHSNPKGGRGLGPQPTFRGAGRNSITDGLQDSQGLAGRADTEKGLLGDAVPLLSEHIRQQPLGANLGLGF